MGSGSYSRNDFVSYAATCGVAYDSFTGRIADHVNHQDIFKSVTIDPSLDPKNVVRGCCDSDEHPDTKPVILALDVTGSMGDAAKEVAKSINNIMTKLYEQVSDIQFMTMGIGDFAYDNFPLQVSQFESDIRIVEQLDKIYFEFGGGGNKYESYTAAWKFGLDHTKLDCYDKRNQKGIIITLGDETLNPYISYERWGEVVGDTIQADIETKPLYEEASKKFDIFHINVKHCGYSYQNIKETFNEVLPAQNYFECNIEQLDNTITNIIVDTFKSSSQTVPDAMPETMENVMKVNRNENGEICW